MLSVIKMAGNQMFRIGCSPVGNVWRGGLPPGCDGEEDVLKNADGRTPSAVFPAGQMAVQPLQQLLVGLLVGRLSRRGGGLAQGEFAADVDADDALVAQDDPQERLQLPERERALVPVGRGLAGREHVLVDGDVDRFVEPEAREHMPGFTQAEGLLAEVDQSSVVARRFLLQLFRCSDDAHFLHVGIRVEHRAHPASAGEEAFEERGLHVGMVVEDDEREGGGRFCRSTAS